MDNIRKHLQGVDSRLAATHALALVCDKHETLDDAIGKLAGKYRLSDADRKLVHAICGFVFRNLTVIDAAIFRIMNRKRAPSPKLLHHLLRVGAAQLLYMDVAEHAALFETVAATGSLHLSRQKSLVNAVLRSVQRQKAEILATPLTPLQKLPEWLRNRWISNYGELLAGEIASACEHQAPIDVTIKDLKAPLEEAQKLGGEYIGLQTVRVHQAPAHVASWPGFEDGAWWIQDIAATLPINMLGDIAGKSVLDMCAAPGGKCMQLAARGANVIALDRSASRMQRVIENLSRVKLGQRVKTVVADAEGWTPEDAPHVILLDAPCSATGTLRRHPELPWNHEENHIEKMAASQRALLAHAAKMLGKQGQILYCTCSLEIEEGENQVEEFLNHHKDFSEITAIPEALAPYLKRGLRDIGWRAFPHVLADKGGMDGFFIALLQKR